MPKKEMKYGDHDSSFWCSTCDRCDVEESCQNCKAAIKQPSGYVQEKKKSEVQ